MSLLKQTSAGGGKQRHLQPVTFKKYDHDETLCVFTLLAEYISRTSPLRGSNTQLLLCHTKPHSPASKDTISRWLKQVMSNAGLDISIFKPHSTRSASTSAAKLANVPLDEIMATAGWRSNSVFATYYHKPIVSDGTFVNAVLGSRSINRSHVPVIVLLPHSLYIFLCLCFALKSHVISERMQMQGRIE